MAVPGPFQILVRLLHLVLVEVGRGEGLPQAQGDVVRGVAFLVSFLIESVGREDEGVLQVEGHVVDGGWVFGG